MVSMLGEYHNRITLSTGAAEDSNRHSHDAGESYDMAVDTAIDLLAAAGLSPTDNDTLGGDIENQVQTLLTLAFHLAPQLMMHTQILLEES